LTFQNQTLIQQLTTMRLLVDPDGTPYGHNAKGSKSRNLSLCGEQTRMVMFLAGTLAIPDEPGNTGGINGFAQATKTSAAMSQAVLQFPGHSPMAAPTDSTLKSTGA
jgi:hypothetical protein